MLDKYIKKIEPIIEELNGKLIEIKGVILPNYLYSFPNGIWLSFDLDKKDNYFDVRLGRLFYFKDVMPRVIVLEKIEYYFNAINELNLNKIKFNFSYNSYDIENMFEILKNNLKIIIENYSQLKENSKTKDLILKEENRLKPYLLLDLSYSKDLELDLKDKINSFTGNKINSNKILKKANKKSQIKSQIYQAIAEILFGIFVICIGLLLAWLFSLKNDIFNIPIEVFIILGIIAISFITFIIYLVVRKNDD